MDKLYVSHGIEIPEESKLLREIVGIPYTRQIHSKNFRKNLTNLGYCILGDIILTQISRPELAGVERVSTSKNLLQLLLLSLLLVKTAEPTNNRFRLTNDYTDLEIMPFVMIHELPGVGN